MSIYDTVTEKHVQIKCTPQPCLHHYFAGEHIPLEDGLYIGYEGWFTVEKSKVKNYGERIYSKWGDIITLNEVLSPHNIIEKVLKERKGD